MSRSLFNLFIGKGLTVILSLYYDLEILLNDGIDLSASHAWWEGRYFITVTGNMTAPMIGTCNNTLEFQMATCVHSSRSDEAFTKDMKRRIVKSEV